MEVAIFTRPLCPEQLGWAKQLLAMGKKVILDWTTGMGIVDQPELLLDEWCEIAHACIAATESVAQALRDRGAQDVTVIPDCVQLLGHKTVKRDYSWKGRLCWHGFGGNLASLLALGPMLNRICEDHGCLVRIIAERLPIHIPFPHELVKWEFGTADAAIVDCDIVLDPHLEGGPFLYKSDNKAVLSWALRMPVLSAPADAPIIERRLLELIGDKWVRRRAGMAGWEYVVANRTEKHFVRAVMAVVERVHSKG